MPLICDQRLDDPLKRVFYYLSVKDLFMLASVSRKLYTDIECYCKETCIRLTLESVVLTLLKQQLKHEIEFHLEFKAANYRYKWLFMIWVKLKGVHRKSVTQYHLSNLANPSYITKKYDNFLQRHILELTNVRLLHCTLTFCSISPGNYRAALRMNINNILWPDHDAPATIITRWEDSCGFHENKIKVKTNEWGRFCDDLRKGNSIRVNGAWLTNYDTCHGWFDFCLDDFNLLECSEVTFEFKDIVNCRWKSGIRWDYVELKQIDWNNN